jgi:hypothetical protein
MSAEPEEQTQPADRRLGEEWADWDGRTLGFSSYTPGWVFMLLLLLTLATLVFVFSALIWLVNPRMVQLGLNSTGDIFLRVIWAAALGYGILVWLGYFGWQVARRLLKSVGGIGWAFPLAQVWGKLFKLSRDQVAHAYLLMHNRMEVLPPVIRDAAKLLLLLPRCLNRETLQGLRELQKKYGFTQTVAAGGTEARRSIAQHRPEGLLAVACARDLFSGIKDVAGRIPVLAFVNEMPEGPCKNTSVDLKQVETALQLFYAAKK